MRIELELPDCWNEVLEERHLYILAGVEEIARKPHHRDWQVKISRCNFCGKCCMNRSSKWTLGRKENGDCDHLIKQGGLYFCDFGIDRPFSCCCGDNADQDYCSVKWAKVK